MLAKRRCDRRKVFARRTVFKHMAPGAEGVLRHGAEMAELRTVLPWPLRGGNEVVLRVAPALGVSARPAVAAVAADDRSRQAGFHRHDSENDRQDLAGTAVVEA